MVRSTSACFATAAALALLMVTTPLVSAQDLCATVICLANGDVECNRVTATCPSCLYTTSSGYSCFEKANGKCPFEDVLLTCPPKAAPTPAPSPTVKPTTAPTPAPAPVTELPATVVPPQIDTPPATTAVSSVTSPPVTKTPAPAPAPTPAPASGSDAGQATGAVRPNLIQINPTSSSNTISGSASTIASTATSPSSSDRSTSTPESKSRTSTPSPSPSAEMLDASNKFAAKKSSSLYVNIGVIVAAVAGVAIVAIFIVRRMRQRNDHGFLTTPEEGPKQFNLQVDGRSTPGNGLHGAGGAGAGAAAAGAGAGFAAGSGAMNGPSVPAPRGHRDSSTSSIGPDDPSLLSMDSINASTVEFANKHPPYGLPSQFGLPSEANPYARSSTASYASSTASSTVSGVAFAQAARAPPPPRPHAIQEGDEFTLLSKRKQSVGPPAAVTRSERQQSVGATNAVIPGGKSTTRPVHKPIYHESVRLTADVPSGRSYEDEYDIVHPRALRDADRRNTETLVMDGRFQSNFSERDVRTVREDRFFATKELEI